MKKATHGININYCFHLFWLGGSESIVQSKSSDSRNMRHAICTLPSEETIYVGWLCTMNDSNSIYAAFPAMKQMVIKKKKKLQNGKMK